MISNDVLVLLVYSVAILLTLTLAGIAEIMMRWVSKEGSRWVIETRRWVVADTSLLRALARLAVASLFKK